MIRSKKFPTCIEKDFAGPPIQSGTQARALAIIDRLKSQYHRTGSPLPKKRITRILRLLITHASPTPNKIE